jgi:subfamily B ATP-binding cassette protein MsbA
MRSPPKSADEAAGSKRHSKAGSMYFVRRLIRYLWPQRRFLIPALICIVIMAAGYSAGVGSLLPLLQVLLSDVSLPGWVKQDIAERRLGVSLGRIDLREEPDSHIPKQYADMVFLADRPKGDSPLTDRARRNDLIIAVDGETMTADELLAHVATAPGGAPLTLRMATRENEAYVEHDVTITPRDADFIRRAALRLTNLLPQGTSREDRLWTLGYILAVLIIISVIQNAARFGGEYLVKIAAARMLVSIRRQMYQKVLRLPMSFFAQRGTSDVMSRFVQDSHDIYRGLTFLFVQALREPLKAAGVFFFALWYSPRVTLFALLVTPPAIVLIRFLGGIVRRANRRLLRGYARMLGTLESALIGIRIVKGYTMERFERRHLFGVDWHMLRQQLRIEMIDAASGPIFEVLGFALGAAATVWFYNEVLDERMSRAGFFIIVVCLAAIFDPLRKLSNLYTRLQRANAAAERVFEVLDMTTEEERPSARLVTLSPLQRTIEFDHLTFTYPGADRPSVVDFTLTVRHGERIALVGPNGSGKTTILGLLMRFFEPQQGRILFDGQDIANVSLKSLRSQIGLVTQETIVFAASVRNNIAYGDERLLRRLLMRERRPERFSADTLDYEKIERAARAAYADEFVRQLPDGYDSPIGEHGATLSGGQRQRIAIARAILRDAPILIFDEATSQIDADSEQKIHRAVEEFLSSRTGFIVAHRFSTIQQADRIVVMDAGRILDVGTHAELLDRSLFYRTLFETQLSAPRGN